MPGMLDNERYVLWERARQSIIADARADKRRLPDWYWDHWHILTAARRAEAEQIICNMFPETALAAAHWLAEQDRAGATIN